MLPNTRHNSDFSKRAQPRAEKQAQFDEDLTMFLQRKKYTQLNEQTNTSGLCRNNARCNVAREMPLLDAVSFDPTTSTTATFEDEDEEPFFDENHGLALEHEEIGMSDRLLDRPLLVTSKRSCGFQAWLDFCTSLGYSGSLSATVLSTATNKEVHGAALDGVEGHSKSNHMFKTAGSTHETILNAVCAIDGTPSTSPSDDVHMLAGWAAMLTENYY